MENIQDPKASPVNLSPEDTPLKKIGAFIKEARMGRDLSIEELSKSLRIGQEQIIALEKGQEELLPEKVFIKAMVRRIAEKLNIEIDFILDEMNDSHLSGSKVSTSKVNKADKSDRAKKIMPIKTIIILSSILGILSSTILVNHINIKANLTGEESVKR